MIDMDGRSSVIQILCYYGFNTFNLKYKQPQGLQLTAIYELPAYETWSLPTWLCNYQAQVISQKLAP